MPKILNGVIVLCLTVFLALPAAAGELFLDEQKPILEKTEIITAGVIRKEYYWETASGSAKINVIEVDLKEPYVKVDVVPGSGKLTERLNVSAVAKDTGAIVAVNGDFYNTQGEGSPIGPMVKEQRLVSSPSKIENIFALGITTDKKAYIEPFSFSGRVIAPNGKEFVLSGINKAIYWEEPNAAHSHINKLHLYNDFWGGKTRGNDSYTTPTEMLIENGRVIEIVQGEYIDSPVPEGMEILRGHGIAAVFLVENFNKGDRITIEYSMQPDLDWATIVGGHALLVDKGMTVPYTKDISALGGIRARTAAGINKDGTILYLVGVEGRTNTSRGLSLTNLSLFLKEIGIYKALNLDGGGSTTMVARPFAEWDTKRVFPTEQSFERLVVNTIAVYTNAPEGELKGLIIEGDNVLLLNEEADYFIKAYDTFFNPKSVEGLFVKWTGTDHLSILEEGKVKALKPGLSIIGAKVGQVVNEFNIEVVAKNSIKKMQLLTPQKQVVEGMKLPVKLELVTNTGNIKEVDASLVDWQFHGFKGQVSKEGILDIKERENSNIGFVVARYQGYSAPLALQFADLGALMSFENLQGLTFQNYPQETRGSLFIISDPLSGRDVTGLEYDFSKASGTTAAYIRFPGNGIVVNEDVQGLLLDIYGDGGNQWLRAEISDGLGNLHRLDFSTNVDWLGWRTLELSLSDKGLTFPLSLKRIYVACPEAQREQRELTGRVLVKDLRSKYDSEYQIPLAKELELTIGKKELKSNGFVTEIDVAPRIVDGRTLVPVRFISEALNSEVKWDAETRNVTVVRGLRWIDLWPGENLMVVDGKAVVLDVSPQLIEGRTMLPLRAIAQALDLSVQWDQKTQTIKLK